MTRVVRAADGRTWAVSSTINWSAPATGPGFEHDIAAGFASGMAMLLLVLILLLTVVLWIPSAVVVPDWLVVLFVLALLVLPLNWVSTRSRTIAAETLEAPELGLPPQRWTGTVHGTLAARREVRRVRRSLERHASAPDDGQGRLHPVE